MIVNCSGIGSLKLVPDPEVYPLRGALVRVWNDGRDFPIVTSAHAVGHDQFNVDKDGNSLQVKQVIVTKYIYCNIKYISCIITKPAMLLILIIIKL